jgi:hypothetical protein
MFANGFAADLGGAATAHEMDHQENEGEHEQDVNEQGCYVKDNERPDPNEKHQEREH